MERISEQPQPQPCIPGGSYTYQVSRHSAEMLSNLNRQRKSGGRFCDVLLRVGEDSFPAHKAVLAACSEYFETVFSSQPDTGENKELEMHTISSKVFRDILDFAYTSRIVVRLESFPELLTAAKFLLMRSIIDICQEVIKQSNVQILVPPPPVRGDMMLFRAGTAVTDLGFPLDMTNGPGLGGTAGSGMGHPQDGDLPRSAVPPMATSSPSVLPALPSVDRLPAVLPPGSPQLSSSSFHSVVGSTSGGSSKRGRGRPRKMLGMDCMMFGSSSLPRETGVFPCGLCGKIFTDSSRLRNHEAQHNVTSLQLGFGDSQQNRLGDNGMPAMDETPRKRGRVRKQVGCEVCGKIFRDVYHLNRHKLSHSGEKPYSCPVCGLRFKRKDRMSYHVRSHDGSVGKPYVCQNCGKGFSRPDHLNGHIKQVHTTERPHKCQTCNASFATRDRLRSHLACHEEKIPCQVCGKYLRAAYMADHLKKHTEGPSNFCGICNRDDPKCPHQEQHDNSDSYGDLSDGSELKSPDKLNQNGPYPCEALKPDPEMERKYPCPDCGSCFRSKSYLNKHIQKAHLKPLAGPLGDLGPALSSPFSPQQNMSLLESFGFQIVQSAFASSLGDSEMEQGPMSVDDK